MAGLTNSQKIQIINGDSLSSGNVTWAALQGKDGVAGINNQFYASGFAMPNGLITTWNKTLFEAHFRAVGQEFYDDGYNLINGAVASPLGRVPRGGRQPEGFTPDPYLNGIATGRSVAGMQAAGVIAAGRHFLLNEQETNRSTADDATRYSSNVDDKTLHEVYAWPFYDGVRAGMMAVMCGMNRVNDTLSCQHPNLLSNLLKTEMGFPGLVLPDVMSQTSAYDSANAGLDLSTQAGALWTEAVLEAGIANGSFSQARLDDMAVRNVIGYYHVGLDDGQQPAVASSTSYRDVRGDHAGLIRQVGQEALVLLKNNNANGGGLPLAKPRTMAVFGAHAGPAVAGPNMRLSVQGTPSDVYQGHLTSGGGSGQLSMGWMATPYQVLSQKAFDDRSMIWWIMNDTYTSTDSGMGGGGGGMPPSPGNTSMPGGGGGGMGGGGGGGGLGDLGSGTSRTPSFESYAQYAGVCLVFINAASGEGADRSALFDADQDAMVGTVADNCNNTVVVANVAGPRVVGAWADHANVTAILYAGLLGEQSGHAIADVLYGAVNPSGKLAYTLARSADDYPVDVCTASECEFSEGVYLDYRYFDARNMSVSYPFGHGLSYTTFAYGSSSAVTATVTNATALAATYPTGARAPGGHADLWDEVVRVTTTVANTGPRDGAEVAQLYLTFPPAAGQPAGGAGVLRGFEKVHVAAGGATADVAFSLRRRDVSYWDVAAQAWAVARGTYTVAVGASSRDIRATATFTV